MNTDDASAVLNSASGDGIVRDKNGEVVFAFYKELGEKEVLEDEALSLMHGLILCKIKKIVNIEVEVDSAILVRLILTKAIGKWPLCLILQQIRLLLHEHSVADGIAVFNIKFGL